MATQKTDFVMEHYQQLVGRRITSVQRMLPEEMDEFAWGHHQIDEAIVLILDDGRAYAQAFCDPEGNGPGWMDFGVID